MTKHIYATIIWVTTGKQYCHSATVKNGQVQVDIWKSRLWFQISNISPTDVSETGQPGNQAPQLLVAWKFTWYLLFMRNVRKCSFLSRPPVKISEVKEAVSALKHLQSWNVCLKFFKKNKSQSPKFSHWFSIKTLTKIFPFFASI